MDEQTVLRLEAKIGRDPLSRAELDELKRTWELLDYLPKPAPSRDFTHRTMSQLTILSQPQSAPKAYDFKRWVTAVPLGWAAAIVLAGGVGFAGVRLFAPPKPATAPETAAVIDPETLARDRRVIENRRLYEHIVSIDFLRELANPDDPDLFGSDTPGS